MSRVLIKNVNIFRGGEFHLGSIVIENDKIITDPSDHEHTTTIIDGSRKFLMPGFIDCHVHLKDRGNLEELASHGITTALDMACWPPSIWHDMKKNTTGVCDFLTAGVPATCPGSEHAKIFGALLEEHLISDPKEATKWVKKRVEEGSHYIKLVADTPIGPSQATLDALVAAAHSRGKQVVCHAAKRRAFEMAIDARCDCVTHAPYDEPLTDEYVARMKEYGLIACPTLALEESRSEKYGLNYPAAKASVKAMYEAGITVLAGTDATGTTGPHPLLYGTTLHHEYELLVEAGLSTVEVLLGTTERAAYSFGLHERGMIADGKRADLVLLNANPIEDVRNMAKIERVWCAGVEVEHVVKG